MKRRPTHEQSPSRPTHFTVISANRINEQQGKLLLLLSFYETGSTKIRIMNSNATSFELLRLSEVSEDVLLV